MKALKDHKGKWSSKRIAGWVLMGLCIFAFLVDMFTRNKANHLLFGTLFAGSLALLGVETVVNGFNNRRNNQRQRQRGVKDSEDA
jgi:uncharacterized membrane protein YidH (DUF202 family)